MNSNRDSSDPKRPKPNQPNDGSAIRLFKAPHPGPLKLQAVRKRKCNNGPAASHQLQDNQVPSPFAQGQQPTNSIHYRQYLDVRTVPPPTGQSNPINIQIQEECNANENQPAKDEILQPRHQPEVEIEELVHLASAAGDNDKLMAAQDSKRDESEKKWNDFVAMAERYKRLQMVLEEVRVKRAKQEKKDVEIRMSSEAIKEKTGNKNLMEKIHKLREVLEAFLNSQRVKNQVADNPFFEGPVKDFRPEETPELFEMLKELGIVVDMQNYLKDIPSHSQATNAQVPKIQSYEEAVEKANALNHRVPAIGEDLSPWLFDKNSQRFPQLVSKVVGGQQIYEAFKSKQPNGTIIHPEWEKLSDQKQMCWHRCAGSLQHFQKVEWDHGMIMMIPEEAMKLGLQLYENWDVCTEFFIEAQSLLQSNNFLFSLF